MRGIEKNGAASRIFQSRIRDTREENFTVVVKTTMKFRSRFVRGNRIRIVSPSGSRNRQLSRVFSLKVTFLPFEIYRTTMRDVARPITLSPNLDIRFFRKEKKEKKKKKNYITLDDM